MRSISRRPWLSNRQSSTFSAFAENSAKLVPRPSHLAPDGCGAPAEIRTLPLRNEKNCRKGRNNKTYVGNCALVQRPDCALVPDIAAAAIQRGVAVEDLAPRPRKWNFDAIVAIESPAGEGGQGHYGRLEALHEQKRRIIDLYASGDLSRDGYVAKNRELDGMIETLNARSKELAENALLLRKTGGIDAAIAQYCEGARVRFNRCTDPASLRAFMLHYVEKVVHLNGKVSLHGRVPVKYEQGDDKEINMLPFCIESEITREERYQERMRTADAMRYQQSMALLREQGTMGART